MRFFSILLVLLLSTPVMANLSTIRDLFAIASTNEEANNKLLTLTEKGTLAKSPLLYAYHAGGLMAMANHVYWPGTKLDYFSKGKDKLEKAISTYPTDVELRFIRYSVQQGVPFFLDYSSNMTEDKKYISKHIQQTGWSADYQKKVLDFLKQSD